MIDLITDDEGITLLQVLQVYATCKAVRLLRDVLLKCRQLS